MPEVKLFPSALCEGYFGTKRFDVLPNGERCHMLSASAIVEVSHRASSLDYESLFQISAFLGGSQLEAKRLFRLMCFNVFAHNQDDHSNNFTWLCDQKGNWSLSPAYDLTYSDGMGGEHATSVLGKGLPEETDLLVLAKEVGLSASLQGSFTDAGRMRTIFCRNRQALGLFCRYRQKRTTKDCPWWSRIPYSD